MAHATDAPAGNHIAAELLVEHPIAPGATGTLALHFSPAPHYHGYWQNPGDAGLGTELKWQGPGKAGSPRYPVPETLLMSGLMNHVYNSDYALLIPYTLPADSKPGALLPISVEARWLACTETMCIPERGLFSVTVSVARGDMSYPLARRFDAWRAHLPATIRAQAHLQLQGGQWHIEIPLPPRAKLENPHFFAATQNAVVYAAPQFFSLKGNLLLARIKAAPGAQLGGLNGVLRLNSSGDGLMVSASPQAPLGESSGTDTPPSLVARARQDHLASEVVKANSAAGFVPSGGEPIATPDGAPKMPALPWLVLAALAGGLLLNIMPCVFPILSLKALSLARAGESEAEARVEGLAYSAGVIVACAVLGALLLALRAAGSQVGWAFQLQEPGVVALLLLLALGITANLLGLYEFAVPGFATRGTGSSRGNSARSAFATGLLAAFVATPCTGPFMASAMGAALLLSVPAGMLLFVALGVGIALPFLAIAFVPALRRALPRPGAWMGWFRRIMAVPMGLTTLALLWLASRLGGMHFAGFCLVLAIVLLAVLAMVGDAQRKGISRGGLAAGMIAVGAAASWFILPHTLNRADTAEADVLGARPYSEAALEAALASGKPVFAYFTADWCLTCKVNERVAIERDDTAAAFRKAGVVVIKGDWTRRDPAITRYLTTQGAAGVPLYVWYPAGKREGQRLPQLLSPVSVINILAK